HRQELLVLLPAANSAPHRTNDRLFAVQSPPGMRARRHECGPRVSTFLKVIWTGLTCVCQSAFWSDSQVGQALSPAISIGRQQTLRGTNHAWRSCDVHAC